MSTDNLEELLRAALDRRNDSPVNSSDLLGMLMSRGAAPAAQAAPSDLGPADALPQRMVADALGAIVTQQVRANPVDSAVSTATRSNRSESTTNRGEGIGQTILNSVGMATGLGPLIAGLTSLFSGGGQETQLPPQPFTAPQRIQIEAGLDAQQLFTPIRYGQDGIAQSTVENGSQPVVAIHVQAMDSRSFLDHSDEIARAVQTALLQSHSLNDVMADL